jgi:NAD(P)H-quinone oxidoreductase subunit 5
MVLGLTGAALLAHALPLNLQDAPQNTLGVVALAGMGTLYVSLVLLQTRPQALEAWRRWSYAGFYVDEYYTRLTLWLWPTRWTPDASRTSHPVTVVTLTAANAQD